MNEEQKAWVDKIKAAIAIAEHTPQDAGNQSNYETLVDEVQKLPDECPAENYVRAVAALTNLPAWCW